MLTLSNVRKSFGQLVAVNGLSLSVRKGEVFGLLGPNGAGKSTTLKLLLNLLWPTSGRAEVLGQPPGSADARRRLGFLPETPAFYDYLTAEELILYFAGLCGLSSNDARRRTVEVLDLVGLGAERRRPLRQFSKGMLQRVGLAQALVHEPELVILDEPMSGLDPVGRREVREIILGLGAQGRTVLFSSHILSDAELLCRRVAILAHGSVVAAGPVSELTATRGPGARGWDVVVTGVSPELAHRLQGRFAKVRAIADTRFAIEVPAADRPETLIGELAAAGASLISVTPTSATLEDVFMGAVQEQP